MIIIKHPTPTSSLVQFANIQIGETFVTAPSDGSVYAKIDNYNRAFNFATGKICNFVNENVLLVDVVVEYFLRK